MKTIFSICALVMLAAISVFVWRMGNREDHFGKAFVGHPSVEIRELVTKPEAFLGRQISVQGILKRQCPATGCWFFLSDPADSKAQELRVDMGDTTPRLPSRLGKLAHLEGQLIKYGDGYQFIAVAVTFR